MMGGNRSHSLAERNLARIIDKQIEFFQYSKEMTKYEESELTRKAQEIVSSYESHLAENPKDVNALILFAKFLQNVGQANRAIDYYLEADLIDPKLAVVKQQIANYLIEEGRTVDAFPFLMMTVKIAPQEATYHFQIGNFIHLFMDELISANILSIDSARSLMSNSFKEASVLAPQTFEYSLRYAQSFFDNPNSNKMDALQVWESLLKNFPERSTAEIDYVNLCKARILIELNQKKAAKRLIQTVTTKNLTKSKLSLLKQAVKQKMESSIPKKEVKQNPDSLKTGFSFPTDEHIFRMRSVSQRLQEEKLLSELKLDVLKARLDNSGNIKVELSKRSGYMDHSKP